MSRTAVELTAGSSDFHALFPVETRKGSVTPLRELELQRQFISQLSHEFRTPLSVIQGANHLLSGGSRQSLVADPEMAARLLELQRRAIASLRELVDQVLLINQLDSCRTKKPIRREVPVSEFVRLIIDGFNETASRGRVELADELPRGFSFLMYDRPLRAAVENLISNALKYSPEASTVAVTLKMECRGLKVDVADHGLGISEKDVAQLFQSFFRGGNVGQVPGTGLGLVVVKRAVDLHGGRISVTSKIGSGSTFSIWLPRHHPKA